jgi:predicted nicotinamide N-methyase
LSFRIRVTRAAVCAAELLHGLQIRCVVPPPLPNKDTNDAMPPKNKTLKVGGDPVPATPVVKSESLLASATEAQATSKSLYGDHKARISSNLHAVHDGVRNKAYMTAITNSMKGKTVLHIGCGMGLLSMFAARAMAKQVVAVDTSVIVHAATEVAKQNNLANLTFLQGSVSDGLKLPLEKFDVILCEWMGCFVTNDTTLLKELMHCKKNHLADGGAVCPNKSALYVAGITDYDYKNDTVEYWNNVYGFSMKAMKPLVLKEPTACSIPHHLIKTSMAQVKAVDVMDIQQEADLTFTAPFSITVLEQTTLHYLTFYNDASFAHPTNAAANFIIGTTPGGRNSWTEVSAILPEALPVFTGDVVTGTVKIDPKKGATTITVSVQCKNALVDHNTTADHHFQY